jgi:hypothetical protein
MTEHKWTPIWGAGAFSTKEEYRSYRHGFEEAVDMTAAHDMY